MVMVQFPYVGEVFTGDKHFLRFRWQLVPNSNRKGVLWAVNVTVSSSSSLVLVIRGKRDKVGEETKP